jgi:oligosaccharide repeat unit polymerase
MYGLIVLTSLISLLALGISFLATYNIFSPTFLSLLLTIPTYAGTVALFVENQAYYELPLYTSFGMLLIAFGSLTAKSLFKCRVRRELGEFRNRALGSLFKSDLVFSMSHLALAALSILMTLYMFTTRGVPLLSGEVFVQKVLVAREGGWLYVRFLRLFLPLLVIINLMDFSRVKRKGGKILLLLLVIYTVGAFILFGYRSYVLNYLVLPMMLTLGYLRPPNRKWLLILPLLAILPVYFITALNWHEWNVFHVSKIILTRLTLEPISGGLGAVLYDLVPREGLLYGRGFLMDVEAVLSRVGLVEGYRESFAQFIPSIIWGENPYGFAASPTLIGESYANFGVFGIIVIIFLFGFALEMLYILTLRGPKDTLLFPLNIFTQLSLILAFGSPFVFMMLDSLGWLMIFSVLFFLVYIFLSLPVGGPRFRKMRF